MHLHADGQVKLGVEGQAVEIGFCSLFKALQFAECLSLDGNTRLIVSDGKDTVFYEMVV